jgi:hypothetical protein
MAGVSSLIGTESSTPKASIEKTFLQMNIKKSGVVFNQDDLISATLRDLSGASDGDIDAVEVQRFQAGGAKISAQATEHQRIHVQRGVAAFSAAELSKELNLPALTDPYTGSSYLGFDRSKSFARISAKITTFTTELDRMGIVAFRTEMPSNDVLRIARDINGVLSPSSDEISMEVAWEIVTFLDDTRVHHGVNLISAGNGEFTPVEVPVLGASVAAKSYVLINGLFGGSAASTQNASDKDVGDTLFTGALTQATLSDPVLLQLQRDRSTHASTVSWSVVEFPQ